MSDLCAAFVGAWGCSAGCESGVECAIFEAVHWFGAGHCGQGYRQPDSAVAVSPFLMLHHLDEEAAAVRVQKALETVYSEGKTLTRDVGGTASTTQFADAVLAAMGHRLRGASAKKAISRCRPG